jgi:hypothetical protein
MGFIITLYLFELISYQQFHVQILYNGNIQRKNHFYVWMNGKEKTETMAYPYLGQRDPGYARTQYTDAEKQSAAKHSELRKQEILTAFKNLLTSCSRKRNQHQST